MRAWITLALVLAVALPVAAQNDQGMMGTSTTSMSGSMISQGTFVSHQAAVGQLPETVTVQSTMNGAPVTITYQVNADQQWMSDGQAVDWSNIQPGAALSVPQGAPVVSVNMGGPVGVGTVTSIDQANNLVTLQLADGQTQTLRYSPNAFFVQNGQAVPASQLQVGSTVAFQLPPSGNSVVAFQSVGQPIQATITNVGDNTITVQYMQNGQQVTTDIPINSATQFSSGGQLISTTSFPGSLQTGQTVWIYGPPSNPQWVAVNPNQGFEAAVVPSTTAAVTGTTTTTITTTTVAAPLSQGSLVSYTPAAANVPAMATFRFNWNGMPLLGTYIIQSQDQWMFQGQPVDWSQIQPGSMITVPASARLVNLTFGAPTAVGVIKSIDTANNIVTVTLPSGQDVPLHYSPQALVLINGQPGTVSQLNVGDTVAFEVPSGTNQVALFTPVQPGFQGTVTAVSDNTITVSSVVNGQTVTRTYPLAGGPRFIQNGQLVSSENVATAFQPGETVTLYGPTESPQIVAVGTPTGYETAMVTPTTTTTTTTTVVQPGTTTTTTVRRTTRTRVRAYRAVRRHRVYRHRRHRYARASFCQLCARRCRAAVLGYRARRHHHRVMRYRHPIRYYHHRHRVRHHARRSIMGK